MTEHAWASRQSSRTKPSARSLLLPSPAMEGAKAEESLRPHALLPRLLSSRAVRRTRRAASEPGGSMSGMRSLTLAPRKYKASVCLRCACAPQSQATPRPLKS